MYVVNIKSINIIFKMMLALKNVCLLSFSSKQVINKAEDEEKYQDLEYILMLILIPIDNRCPLYLELR